MLLGAEARHAHPLHQADRLVLAVVVVEHQAGDLVGHRLEQRIAVGELQLAGLHLRVEQDLDVHLVVGGVHAGGVVDEVGIEQHAVARGLDAAELGHAQVAALADHAATQVAAIDADRVVGAIADIGVLLGAALDVGADAAVPQQVDRRPEHRRQQCIWRHRGRALGQAQCLARLRRDFDRFERARVHAAAPGDQLGVIVRPARTRHLEQARALLPGTRRIGIRVDEHVAMVERRHQADVPGQQHAVAEHVAGHVADAHAAEVLRLRVVPQRAEVALDRLPGAARGDAHALVVVADRAPRCERIVQPEAVVARDAVGGIGEGGRALVGGDDQVGVVLVVAHHVARRHDLAFDDVVGDVEHAADEQPVAGHALGEQRIAVAAHRRALDDEAALGADRHDHRVLHHLRLDQAQHLGAEILAPVGPAQAAARDRAEAQVRAFDARAVHEDLAVGPGLGQLRHVGRIELEGDGFLPAAVAGALEVAGAQGGVDHAHEAAQDAVLVEAGHVVQQRPERAARGFGAGVAVEGACIDHRLQYGADRVVAADQRTQLRGEAFGTRSGIRTAGAGIEARLEQLDQHPRDQRIADERLLDIALRERHAHLQQVLGVAAQQRDLAPGQRCAEHQAVEAIVFRIAAPGARKRLGEIGSHLADVEASRRGFHLEVLDVQRRAVAFEPIGMLGDHAQAEVLHQRQGVRQGDVAAAAVQLEAQRGLAVGRGRQVLQRQLEGAVFPECRQALDVGGGDLRRGAFDIARRQCAAIAVGQCKAPLLPLACDQRIAQVLLPVAHDRRQLALELGLVDLDLLAAARTHDQVHLRQRRLADRDVGIDVVCVQYAPQHGLHALAHLGAEAVAGNVDQHRMEATIAVAAQEQAAAHPLLQAEHAGGQAVEFILGRLEQLVARQRLEDVLERLATVPVGLEARPAHHVLVALAYQRDVPGAAVVRARGVQAEEALLGHGAPIGVEAEYTDVVHVAGTVHGRARIGLGQHQHLARPACADVVRGQGLERPALAVATAAQQAQAAVLDRHQQLLPALAPQSVLAIAEEGEVVVRGPAQELLRLVARGIAHRQAPAAEVAGHLLHPLAHHRPVPDDGAHVVQHLAHGGLDRRHAVAGLPVDLQMHHRFGLALAHAGQAPGLVARDLDHRMAKHVHAHAGIGQRHGHRVDQEGHVVVDDLQHRARRVPAVAVAAGVEQAHQRRARPALARELEQVQGQRGPGFRRVRGQFVLGHAPVQRGGKGAGVIAAGLARALADRIEDRLQTRRRTCLTGYGCLPARLAAGVWRVCGCHDGALRME